MNISSKSVNNQYKEKKDAKKNNVMQKKGKLTLITECRAYHYYSQQDIHNKLRVSPRNTILTFKFIKFPCERANRVRY